MTLSTVAADDPIEASLANQLIANVNGSPGVAFFTADGSWAVPAGVHKFKVTVVGGGGAAGGFGSAGGGEDIYSTPGGPGGDSLARSVWVSGAEIGTTYVITIGAGGTSGGSGGTTSFGSLLTVNGGGEGGSDSLYPREFGSKGSTGSTAGGSLAGSAVLTGNKRLPLYDTVSNIPRHYGEGGPATMSSLQLAGAPGLVMIEW